MADGAKANGCKILQFRPKRAKSLPPIRETMPSIEKRRISYPISLAPMKGKECAFRASCKRECVEPERATFTDEIKVKLRLEAEHWLRLMNKLTDINANGFREKTLYAMQATWALDGAVIPVGGEKGGGSNCLCGKPLSGKESMKQMQAFTNEQMREAMEGAELWAELTGAYIAARGCQVSGLHPEFAGLLGRFANLRLPYDDSALKILMIDGGLNGIRTIARMAAEPTVPHEARMKYVWAMGKVVSSADFSGGNAKIINDYLALGLSRFYPFEEIKEVVEGMPVCWMELGRSVPRMSSKPDFQNLKQMIEFSISEFFQSIVNMSARIDEMGSASVETIKQHQKAAQSIYAGLREAIKTLAGNDQPNKSVLWGFCKKKANEYQWEELHPGEQAMAKYLLRKMWGRGELDTDSVDRMLEVLNAEEVDAEKCIKDLNLE